jgi:two-component system, NtrC family, response regulator
MQDQSSAPAASDLGHLLDLPLDQATRELERILVTRALAQSHGNKAEAARALGIHRQHLYAKLREFGME